ncbi:MAG: hypothetical protein AAGG75_15470 [Bacteroidota bacterium]
MKTFRLWVGRSSLLLILWLLALPGAMAQVPANPIGLNPFGLKWNQIETDKVQVVFPQGMEVQGQRVAQLVHMLHDRDNVAIGNKKDRVSIFLQNQGVLSNGFVTVGPFRSEFYTTPPQFDCTTDWLDLLTIHEYRHVQQFINSRHGITGFIRKTFGSWPFGGLMATALPRWYFEGDATITETALTNSGRGRLPAFEMEYKSLLLSGRRPSYDYASAGSLQSFIPDWYTLGYYLMSYGRERYGAELWRDVAEDAVRYKGLTFPFSKTLRSRTGLKPAGMYEEMYDAMQKRWQTELEQRNSQTDAQLRSTRKKRTVIDYNNPLYIDDRRLIVTKRGYNELPSFYLIDEAGKERLLARPGVLGSALNSTLSYAADKVCWAELGFDLRWGNRSYSVIRVQNIRTGRKVKLTKKSRYYSPAFSPDGKRILVVEASIEGYATLVILDAETGAELQRLENPEQWFYSFPRWMEAGEQIVTVAKRGGEMQLQRIDLRTGRAEGLSPRSNAQLSHPFPKGDKVYFSAAYTGTNNIFVVDQAGQLRQLTDVALGAFQPAVAPDGRRLAYSSFSVEGYEIREMTLQADTGQPYTPPPVLQRHYAELMAQQEGGDIIPQLSTTSDSFPVKKYRTWTGLINPHSILPLIEDPLVGASILADNKFSTLSMEAGGFYNYNDNEWTFIGTLTYAELFPVINLNHRFADRTMNQNNYSIANDTTVVLSIYSEEVQENRTSLGFTLPFNFSAGRYATNLRLSANYQLLNLDVDEARFDRPQNFRDTIFVSQVNRESPLFRERLTDGTRNAMDLRFTFFSFRRRAIQHLESRFAFVFDARYRRLLDGEASEVFTLRSDVYLPGFARNHSFSINGLYQRQDILDAYRFPNFFVYPRGHNGVLGDNVYKIGFNYSLPLLYPDVPITNLAFLKRVKANLFYDYGRFNFDNIFRDFSLQSAGVELTFDLRWLRLVEVDCGVRYSYLIDEGLGLDSRHQFDFLILSITQ